MLVRSRGAFYFLIEKETICLHSYSKTKQRRLLEVTNRGGELSNLVEEYKGLSFSDS